MKGGPYCKKNIQKDISYKSHEDWRGNLVQGDDVLVIGIRV
jgi:hypothetical protein